MKNNKKILIVGILQLRLLAVAVDMQSLRSAELVLLLLRLFLTVVTMARVAEQEEAMLLQLSAA